MQIFNNITVVLNPTAGSDTALGFRTEVMDALLRSFPSANLTMLHTTSADDPEHLGATVEADLIISLSGDGTVHGLAQGLMRRNPSLRPVLTVIPVGSGNDIARTFSIPKTPAKAVQALANGRLVPCDLGRIVIDKENPSSETKTVYFLQTLSFGVDAAVAMKTVELRRKTRQRESVLYARAAVGAILTELHANHIHYSLDNETFEEELLIMAIQNGPTYGGGFMVAPAAKIDDGFLDIITATKMNVPKALYSLNQMKRGTHGTVKGFRIRQAQTLSVTTKKQLPVQVDGEALGGTDFKVDVLREAITILAPSCV
jgi:YegS/Rv2252/BmrU family lipid kinase